MSRGTWRATGGFGAPATLRFARDGEPIAIGDIEVHPFTVAHDAAEPLQLRCSDGGSAAGRAHRPRLDHRAHDRQRRRLRRDRPRVQPRRRDAGGLALSGVAEGAHRRPLRPPQQRHGGRDPGALRQRAAAARGRRPPEPREQPARPGAGGARRVPRRRPARRSSSPIRRRASTGCSSAEAPPDLRTDRPCKRPPEGGLCVGARARITSRRRSRRPSRRRRPPRRHPQPSGGHRRRRGGRGGVGVGGRWSRRWSSPGAGGVVVVVVVVSSFLLQAAKETAAASVTINSAVLIFLLGI